MVPNNGNFTADYKLSSNVTGSPDYLAQSPNDIEGTARANPPSVGAYEFV
ncbi:hypothetical protein THIOSC15_2720023 [uncultured Thiomicrorhabdus sp.]